MLQMVSYPTFKSTRKRSSKKQRVIKNGWAINYEGIEFPNAVK